MKLCLLFTVVAALGSVSSLAAGAATPVIYTSGGAERVYQLYVPPTLQPGTPAPLVVALHGGGGTSARFFPDSGWIETADREGLIVAFPNGGIPNAGTGGFRWNLYDWTSAPDDAAAMASVARDVERFPPVRWDRVFLTGFSAGAAMTNTAAFVDPGTFAAFASVSGLWMTTQNIEPLVDSPTPPRPVPTWIWRGERENQLTGTQTRDVQDELQRQFWVGFNDAAEAGTPIFNGAFSTQIYAGDSTPATPRCGSRSSPTRATGITPARRTRFGTCSSAASAAHRAMSTTTAPWEWRI